MASRATRARLEVSCEAAAATPSSRFKDFRISASTPVLTENILEHFEIEKEIIGRGQYGIVRKCIHKNSGAVFACKTINKVYLQKKNQLDALANEISASYLLHEHPNIVRQVAAFEDSELFHLVMEFCCGGDLFDLVKMSKKLREVDTAWLFRKVVWAVAYCHCRGIVHRDLKPENILISVGESIEPKLADFGLAVKVYEGEKLEGLAGSPFYMAPEVWSEKSYDMSVDIWSLGITLYFMLSGSLPFEGKTSAQISRTTCSTQLDLSHLASISFFAKLLIKRMLDREPRRRPKAVEILNCHWFRELGFPPISYEPSTKFEK